MSSSSSPCAACKLLRRKCTQGCVFAPYFPPDQPSKFANVHRVFGASNVAKLLNDLPPAQREDAVNSLAYEADARLRDPVYGCVAYISILQLKIKQVREDLAAARKELANYIGPAAFAPFHPAAAATAGFVGPHQYQGTQYGVAGVGLAGVGIASPAAQHAHAHAHMMQQQQHMVEEQQMAAAVEVAAREQEMMMRQAAAYGHAATAGAATVAVMPSGSAEAYEGASFLVPQHSPQAAGAAVAATYRVEPSPPTTQSNSHVERPQAQQQRAGSDEASGGVARPA